MTCLSNKVLEVRDAGTFIPVLATKMLAVSKIQAWYVHGRSGYPTAGSEIILTRLSDGNGNCDPYSWPNRTMAHAHHFIIENWEELADGDVVDVEFIMGFTSTKKVSERLTVHSWEAVHD